MTHFHQHRLEIALARVGGALCPLGSTGRRGVADAGRRLREEDLFGQHVEIVARAFQQVTDPFDDAFEDADQDLVGRIGSGFLAARDERVDGSGFLIAHRDHLIAREDEGDRRNFHHVIVGARQHVGGQEVGPVFRIEAARQLDLAHFREGRHADPEGAFQSRFLIRGRPQHINPDRRVEGAEMFAVQHELAGRVGIGADHVRLGNRS